MAWEIIILAVYLAGIMVIGLMSLWVDQDTSAVPSSDNSAESTTEVKTDRMAA